MVFNELAESIKGYIVEKRRYFHQHPELSWQEFKTSDAIEAELKALGIETRRFKDRPGVLGFIRGGKPGRTVALRADIDALPIRENADVPFKSLNDGVMHACGHDCHIAMLLGAAKMLTSHKEELHGDVRLVFQAAEETCHGAEYYVEQGALDGVDAIFGMHIWSMFETKKISVEPEGRMASCDNFKITVRGKACHGSAPHQGVDAIAASAMIIQAIQSFVSRRNSPLNPLVVSIGTIKGGNMFNIVADKVEMEGTIRTFSRELRKSLEASLRSVIEHAAATQGAEAELEYWYFPGPVINDHEDLNRIAREAAVKLYGDDGAAHLEKMTGSEDFTYFMEKVPGFFAFLGCGNPAIGAVYPHHSDKFKVDEDALPRGAALHAQFALDYLASSAAR